MEFISCYEGVPRSSLEARQKNVKTMTVEEFERTNIRRVGYMLNEYMDNNRIVRPYYDYDRYLDTSTGKIDPVIFQGDLDIFKSKIHKLHGDAEAAYAQRNGLKMHEGKMVDYISLRAYVKGFKMHVSEIGYLIRKTWPNGDHGLDLNVYKAKDQCMCVINGHKTMQDLRFLTPITHVDEKRAFLAQYLYGDEELIRVPAPPDAAAEKKKKNKCQTLVKRQAAGPIVEEMREEEEEVEDEINRVNKTPLSWMKCERALRSIGFVNPTWKRTKDDGFDFDADRSLPCAACGNRIHDSYDFYILQLFGSFFVVKSYSQNCTSRYINFDDNLMENVINHPLTHLYYAQFFSTIYRNRLVWTTARRFMYFNGAKWGEVTTEEVNTILIGTLTTLLQYLAKYNHETQFRLDDRSNFPDNMSEEEKKKRKDRSKKHGDWYRKALAGIDYIAKDTNVKAILNMCKNLMISPAFEDTLDRDGWLLGFDNGVVNLKTLEYRQAKASDRVSMSTGYDFVPKDSIEWNEDLMDAVREFLGRIYPMEDEHEMVQRAGGYNLTGVHPCKVVVIHTDTRKGNNGKSKYSLMLMSALGPDYSKDGGAGLLLYKNDKQENVNSHQAGMLEYDKKRLVVFEELTSSKSLDNELLKKLNGGAAEFEGRQAYGRGDIRIPWVTKMMMCCNNRKFPAFDWTDDALLDRLIIIHHRSRFCTTDEQYERDKHEPYTYRAIDKDEEIKGIWRPYIMHWLLEGLQNWHKKRFREIPAVCKEWKAALVSVQDTVTPWIQDHLQKSEDKNDYVCRSELYNLFKEAVPEERNRKTKLGLAAFAEKVTDYLETTCDERPYVEVTGEDGNIQKKQLRNAWLGWKYIYN